MGKNYSYTVVVEAGGRLLINQQVVQTPDEVTSGAEDVLGWALTQVREQYAALHAQDSANDLTLKVEDRRPGGLMRRAKFTHPDEGITLASFQGVEAATVAKEEVPPVERPDPETPPPQPPPRAAPAAPAAAPAPAEQPPAQEVTPSVEESQPEVADEPSPVQGPVSAPADAGPQAAPARQEEAPAPARPPSTTPSRDLDTSSAPRDVQGARGTGWRKIEPDKITRPQVGSAKSDGRSIRTGIIASARQQKWVQSVGIGVVILLVIVGFRMFNGGEAYEAYCVDQRTQTRAVAGVACQDSEDTNHRWWYTSDKENAPDVGDSINSSEGTFDEPKGDKVTINRHVEEGS